MLLIDNVSKKYEDHIILNKVTFSVDECKILGLAGPSGSGKSTLLRCIQKLENVDSGAIKCDHKTGFMFQDFQLFPHMTVLQNLLYAPSVVTKNQDSKDHIKYANKLLKDLGLKTKAGMYPKQLSGGQKQRVALARSLMLHPDLLLCDEPTSGLDVATTSDVVALLKSVRDLGITMVIASHDLDFLTKIADNIILLKDGNIVTNIEPKSKKDPITFLKEYY